MEQKTMQFLSSEELKNMLEDLYANGSDDLANGNFSGNIGDAISEVADSWVDIYYGDVMEWAKNHINDVNRGIDEMGSSGDVFKDIQMAQYLCNEEEIDNEIDDIIKNYAINFIIDNDLKITQIQWDEIEEQIDNIDNNNDFSDIDDIINEIINNDNE